MVGRQPRLWLTTSERSTRVRLSITQSWSIYSLISKCLQKTDTPCMGFVWSVHDQLVPSMKRLFRLLYVQTKIKAKYPWTWVNSVSLHVETGLQTLYGNENVCLFTLIKSDWNLNVQLYSNLFSYLNALCPITAVSISESNAGSSSIPWRLGISFKFWKQRCSGYISRQQRSKLWHIQL